MAWFQLDPQSIAARAGNVASPPTLAGSVLLGTVGFTIVSVAGFIPWAVFGRWLYPRFGEAGLYAICAAVFIVSSGVAMHRLIIGPGSLVRFYKLFAPAFSAYSVAWIGCWLWLGGHAGGIGGLFLGTAAMGAMLACAFDAQRSMLKIIAALFVLNTAGYYVGGWVESQLIREYPLAAMLGWGVFYGIGLGAGLGLAFYECQAESRRMLARVPPSAP